MRRLFLEQRLALLILNTLGQRHRIILSTWILLILLPLDLLPRLFGHVVMELQLLLGPLIFPRVTLEISHSLQAVVDTFFKPRAEKLGGTKPRTPKAGAFLFS